jgi:hypothetical protein
MTEVTFSNYSKVLKKSFIIIENYNRNISDYDLQLRACAMNWTIESIERL